MRCPPRSSRARSSSPRRWNGGETESALADIDAAMAARPEVLDYAMLKLRVLVQMGDRNAIEAHLLETFERFPDDTDVQRTLVAWYLENRDFDAAERVLRELAGPETGAPGGHVTVVRLIEQVRGREAALTEVDRLIEANAALPANDLFYRSLRASYRFDMGAVEEATGALRAALEAAEAERQELGEGEARAGLETQIRRVKGILARIELASGNLVGARALVEEVLAQDSADVVALQLRGAMLIEDDRPDEAIVDLRRALSQDPRNTDLILLLAEAHGRGGNRELMGERLATAVEVSGAAPRESLRYAEYLLSEGRAGAARTVLADAREANPDNVEVLVRMGQLALQQDTLGALRGVIADLERIADAAGGTAEGTEATGTEATGTEATGAEATGAEATGTAAALPGTAARAQLTEQAARAARSLRTALLLREDRREEGLAMLAEQAGSGGQDARSVLALVRARIAAGELGEARSYLDQLRAEAPEDANLRIIDAALLASEGDLEASEAMLRALLEETPSAEGPVRMLHRQLLVQGRADEAEAVLQAGLEAAPESRPLRLLAAGEAERQGDYEAAIALYDTLYEQNSSDVVVANNLASMLSTYRDDDESLERAAAVAQRLRGTDVAPFQDTYGWIAYRRGAYGEALDYLEPAARGLSDNALVQYHLGMTYHALERTEDAKAALTRALTLAGDADLEQFETARATLAEIEAGAADEAATEGGANQ